MIDTEEKLMEYLAGLKAGWVDPRSEKKLRHFRNSSRTPGTGKAGHC